MHGMLYCCKSLKLQENTTTFNAEFSYMLNPQNVSGFIPGVNYALERMFSRDSIRNVPSQTSSGCPNALPQLFEYFHDRSNKM